MPKGGVMFELGANFGYYAITIATALDGDRRIYAFEPNPSTMQRFRKMWSSNGTRAPGLLELGFPMRLATPR